MQTGILQDALVIKVSLKERCTYFVKISVTVLVVGIGY